MGVSSFSVFSLLFALLSGGANDMLDFVSTDAYWKAKNVVVTPELLAAELKPLAGADIAPLIKALDSGNPAERDEATKKILAHGPAALPQLEKSADDPDPEVSNRVRSMINQIRLNSKAASVRRLMAIRTLGEMKNAAALPVLQPLLKSTEMFVADYAARAIAQIEGKPAPTRAVPPDALKADLALLPANCGILGQVSFVSGKRVSIDQLMKEIPAQPGENRQESLDMITNGIIAFADQVGNVRVEAITFGVADTIGPNDGFAAAIVRGQYDAQALSNFVRGQMPNSNAVEGVEVFSPDANDATVRFAFASDQRAFGFSGAAADKIPVKDVLAAINKKPAPHPVLALPEFAPFVASLDENSRAWAVCKVSDSYRTAPVVAPFDSFTLVTRQDKDNLNIRLAGAGKDAGAVKDAVAQVNSFLDMGKQQVPRMVQQMPFMKPIADFMNATQCEADGKNATLSSTFKGDTATLLALPLMGMGIARQEVRAAPAQVQIRPAQPEQPEPPKPVEAPKK
jgi:hypothetical protein